MIFLTELGIPTGVPNEVVLLLAGAYAIHSLAGLLAGVVFVSAADISGATALYCATRTGGAWLVNRLLRKLGREPEQTFNRWRARLGERDVLVVVVGRMLPLVRMTVAVGAGLLRIPADDFVIGVLPGGFFWAGVPLALGYLYRGHVHRLIRAYHHVSHVTLLLLPPLLALGLLVWLLRRRQAAGARPRSSVAKD
ncbi:MAG TPA: VTT domain-containing protein [Thermomicrobiaceae bacterium]|nr:VTT domain-containing protein [Thermomicrobiaceae bacterium]